MPEITPTRMPENPRRSSRVASQKKSPDGGSKKNKTKKLRGGKDDSYNLSKHLGISSKSSSKLSYYITIYMELQEGTTLNKDDLKNIKCRQKWNAVRKAYADFTGQKYIIPPVYNNTPKNKSGGTRRNTRHNNTKNNKKNNYTRRNK